MTRPDYLGESDLLSLDIAPTTVAILLRDSPLSGHRGRPLVSAEELPGLLAQLDGEEGQL